MGLGWGKQAGAAGEVARACKPHRKLNKEEVLG